MTGPHIMVLIADDAPFDADVARDWVRLADGVTVAQGHDLGWREHVDMAGDPVLLIVPASVAPVRWLRFDGLSLPQAEGAAAHAMRADRLSDAEHLHAAARGEQPDGTVAAATVNRGWLTSSLAALAGAGADIVAAVPIAALLPAPADGTLAAIAIGSVGAVRTATDGFDDDPALVTMLGQGHEVAAMPPGDVAAALAAAAIAPPLDLLTGAFRRRPDSAITPAWRRLLLRLAAALIILSLAVPLVQMVRWKLATNDADAATVTRAADAGLTAPDAPSAEAAIDRRLAERGGGPLALSVPMSALIAAMQPVPGVSVQTMAHRADGTLSITLAAPRIDDVNAVLLALQSKGYLVTAQPLQGADGLQKGSITIRAVP